MIVRYQLWEVGDLCAAWGVDYFLSAEAAEAYDMHRETISDFAKAEQRAASLGKTKRYVKLVGIRKEEGSDIFIASFGTSVDHRVRRLRNDPRGCFACGCGAMLASEADMGLHLDIAEMPE